MPTRKVRRMPRNQFNTTGTRPRRRCDNPDCTSFVDWPDSASRPPLFCSSACRQRCRAGFERLTDERATLQSSAQADGLRYFDRRALQSRMAMLDWLLSAYPYTRR